MLTGIQQCLHRLSLVFDFLWCVMSDLSFLGSTDVLPLLDVQNTVACDISICRKKVLVAGL
jgi:hypothetical protein